jgi:hypothetical protein
LCVVVHVADYGDGPYGVVEDVLGALLLVGVMLESFVVAPQSVRQ